MVIAGTILLGLALFVYRGAKYEIEYQGNILETHELIIAGLVIDFLGRLGYFWVTWNTVEMSPGYWLSLPGGLVLTAGWFCLILFSDRMISSPTQVNTARIIFWIWFILTLGALVQQIVRLYF